MSPWSHLAYCKERLREDVLEFLVSQGLPVDLQDDELDQIVAAIAHLEEPAEDLQRSRDGIRRYRDLLASEVGGVQL
jgi:hypothetical protein